MRINFMGYPVRESTQANRMEPHDFSHSYWVGHGVGAKKEQKIRDFQSQFSKISKNRPPFLPIYLRQYDNSWGHL